MDWTFLLASERLKTKKCSTLLNIDTLKIQKSWKMEWWWGKLRTKTAGVSMSPAWCRDVVCELISDDIPSVIWLLSAWVPTTESARCILVPLYLWFWNSNRLEYNTIALSALFCFIVNWLWNFEVMNRSFETLTEWWYYSPILLRCSLDKFTGTWVLTCGLIVQ